MLVLYRKKYLNVLLKAGILVLMLFIKVPR